MLFPNKKSSDWYGHAKDVVGGVQVLQAGVGAAPAAPSLQATAASAPAHEP